VRGADEFVRRIGENVRRAAEHFRSERKLNTRQIRHEERRQILNSRILPGFDVLFLERYGAHKMAEARAPDVARWVRSGYRQRRRQYRSKGIGALLRRDAALADEIVA